MQVGNCYLCPKTDLFEKCWVVITYSNPCQGIIMWDDGKCQASMITDKDMRGSQLIGRNVKMRPTL